MWLQSSSQTPKSCPLGALRPSYISRLGVYSSLSLGIVFIDYCHRDIDLVIQSDQMAYSDRVRVLHALANCMRRADIAEKVTVIAKAKVPIIKFITKIGRFAVDISINQLNGVAAGRMVNRFIQELPALRALVLVTKSFLSQRSMNEVFTGGLGSYSIVCLAASFLQMHPKIRRGEIDPAKNLGVLVMEFFELYGLYFNYRDVGISLRDGGTYYNKGRRGWADFKNDALLSIEDPADPGKWPTSIG